MKRVVGDRPRRGSRSWSVGCGTQNYEYRLEHTIEQMKYQKRLDDNLTDRRPRASSRNCRSTSGHPRT